MALKIHPSVGIARLGNSGLVNAEEAGNEYLVPSSVGGLPTELDGTTVIESFKDDIGCIRRQGQLFKLYNDENDEVTLDTEGVKNIEWTVHLANKKAAWYQYSELQGNLLYGEDNSYQKRGVDFRNKNVEEENRRREELIIDSGPRMIEGKNKKIQLTKDDTRGLVNPEYPVSFPKYFDENGNPTDKPQNGLDISSLGTIRTDDKGRLIVFGGYGSAGGDEPLTSYGGSDSWYDDIADGSVVCTVTYNNGTETKLNAWVIVGSPDFAPEIVNISTLDDTFYDVGIRKFNLNTAMCDNGTYNSEYEANYQRDILPIIERMKKYQWVANVQSMSSFFSNDFDFSDNCDEQKGNREQYYNYFRKMNEKVVNPTKGGPQETLFREENNGRLPMMPMNSGSNSVTDTTIEKFLALNETQMFLLGQWKDGKFNKDTNSDGTVLEYDGVNSMDRASVGNCVGLPMSPGIEVTWSVQHEAIYEAPYQIKHKEINNNVGLTPSRDECKEGDGCEPGDLTKRMACPWQADFFNCTVQNINFTNPLLNDDPNGDPSGTPMPPTYYAYWWPPQSPWDVLTDSNEDQENSHLSAGEQVNYQRGINNFKQMVEHWAALAFIRDNNASNKGYPYFTETERNHEIFEYKAVPTSEITGNSEDDGVDIPIFYIPKAGKDDGSLFYSLKKKGGRAERMSEYFEKRAFRPIEVAPGGLGLPRSGTRVRR